jgi:dihydrofolate synthase/folylpolyglutamate synthase
MLKDFLDKKPLYYSEIDYTRMPRVYKRINSFLPKPKIIHLIGTNGKGTTGRFLATALYNLGYRVGHYTSPHILKFNERVWHDGKNITDTQLEKTHKKLQKILTKQESDSLSYFEYTTFLAILFFKECEFVVLEAGLGGEHDGTAVFDKELTLVTTIDIDHKSFLGETIEQIATTKLHAMQKNLILGNQKFDKIEKIALEIAKKKGTNLYIYDELLSSDDVSKIKQIAQKIDLVPYLVENLKLAVSALRFLDIEYGVQHFENSKLFGRLSRVDKNILVDVGHNPLAAKSILKALLGKRYILVYNSYKDKDYKEILDILKPIIQHVEIIEIDDERVLSKELLQNALNSLEIKYTSFKNIDKEYEYLVFGSFSVVEQFLKVYSV